MCNLNSFDLFISFSASSLGVFCINNSDAEEMEMTDALFCRICGDELESDLEMIRHISEEHPEPCGSSAGKGSFTVSESKRESDFFVIFVVD